MVLNAYPHHSWLLGEDHHSSTPWHWLVNFKDHSHCFHLLELLFTFFRRGRRDIYWRVQGVRGLSLILYSSPSVPRPSNTWVNRCLMLSVALTESTRLMRCKLWIARNPRRLLLRHWTTKITSLLKLFDQVWVTFFVHSPNTFRGWPAGPCRVLVAFCRLTPLSLQWLQTDTAVTSTPVSSLNSISSPAIFRVIVHMLSLLVVTGPRLGMLPVFR